MTVITQVCIISVIRVIAALGYASAASRCCPCTTPSPPRRLAGPDRRRAAGEPGGGDGLLVSGSGLRPARQAPPWQPGAPRRQGRHHQPGTGAGLVASHPQANVGLATGHRFDVLDVDGPKQRSSRPGRRTPSTTSSMTSGGRTRPSDAAQQDRPGMGGGRATTTGPAARRRHPDRQLSRPRRGAVPLAPVCRRGGDRRLRRRHRVRATVGRPVLQRGQRPQTSGNDRPRPGPRCRGSHSWLVRRRRARWSPLLAGG